MRVQNDQLLANGQKGESDGHVSLQKKPLCTISLLVLSVLACLAVFISYGLYIQKQTNEFRIIYDVSMLMLVVLVVVVCLIYFWEYLYEPIYPKMFPLLSLKKNNPNVKEKERSQKCSEFNFCAVISDHLQFSQNTLCAFMCIIHQIFLAILTWSGVINGNTDQSYIITGFVCFFQAFSITLPGFALTTFCEGREHINKQGSVISGNKSHKSYGSKHLASQQSIFKDGGVVLSLLFTLLVQFIVFVTYPTLNHDNFKLLTFVIYNCDSAQSCAQNPFFLINEILFRIFVGITLLDAIFLTVSNLLGDTIHHTSLKYIYKVLNPCIWPFLAILALSEIDILYTKDNSSFEQAIDWIWIGIHGITILIALFLICHSKNVFSSKLEPEIEKFYQMNKKREKSTFMQGAIVWILYVIYYVFLFLSEDAEINWSIIRQGIVLLFLTFESMVLYYFKQCENHPKYRKYFMKYWFSQQTQRRKKMRCINWINVLQWIAILNLYNLINSFVFEISHFIELFRDSAVDTANMFFLIAFSFSFAGSHFNFWCLTMIIGVLHRYYVLSDEYDGSKSKEDNFYGRTFSVESTNGSERHNLATEHQFYNKEKRTNVITRKQFKKIHSKSLSLQCGDDSASMHSLQMDENVSYNDPFNAHMIPTDKDQINDGSLYSLNKD